MTFRDWLHCQVLPLLLGLAALAVVILPGRSLGLARLLAGFAAMAGAQIGSALIATRRRAR